MKERDVRTEHSRLDELRKAQSQASNVDMEILAGFLEAPWSSDTVRDEALHAFAARIAAPRWSLVDRGPWAQQLTVNLVSMVLSVVAREAGFIKEGVACGLASTVREAQDTVEQVLKVSQSMADVAIATEQTVEVVQEGVHVAQLMAEQMDDVFRIAEARAEVSTGNAARNRRLIRSVRWSVHTRAVATELEDVTAALAEHAGEISHAPEVIAHAVAEFAYECTTCAEQMEAGEAVSVLSPNLGRLLHNARRLLARAAKVYPAGAELGTARDNLLQVAVGAVQEAYELACDAGGEGPPSTGAPVAPVGACEEVSHVSQ